MGEILDQKDQRGVKASLLRDLDLEQVPRTLHWAVVLATASCYAAGVMQKVLLMPHMQVLDRDVEHLSGGELQRFAIAVVAAQQADVYMIDEPSSYLDVRQRLKAAQACTAVLQCCA